MTLTPDEKDYLEKYADKWVRVTRGKYASFQPEAPLVGVVIGWHWYDGIVLHVQPAQKVSWQEEPYQVAFDFDTIELCSA